METINIGNIANDGTGDDLRVAFRKVNTNFSELETAITNASATFAENVGDTGVGVYLQKANDTLQFKKLVNGDLLSITDNGDTITIDTDFTGKTINGISDLNVEGNITAGIYFLGNLQGNVVGNLIGTVYSPIGGVAAQGDIVGINGLITNVGDPNYNPAKVDGIPIQELNRQLNNFDFGNISGNIFSDPISYLLSQIGADLGTILSPAPYTIDCGSFI